MDRVFVEKYFSEQQINQCGDYDSPLQAELALDFIAFGIRTERRLSLLAFREAVEQAARLIARASDKR